MKNEFFIIYKRLCNCAILLNSFSGEHQSSPAITNSEPDPYNPDPVETPAAA